MYTHLRMEDFLMKLLTHMHKKLRKVKIVVIGSSEEILLFYLSGKFKPLHQARELFLSKSEIAFSNFSKSS